MARGGHAHATRAHWRYSDPRGDHLVRGLIGNPEIFSLSITGDILRCFRLIGGGTEGLYRD